MAKPQTESSYTIDILPQIHRNIKSPQILTV